MISSYSRAIKFMIYPRIACLALPLVRSLAGRKKLFVFFISYIYYHHFRIYARRRLGTIKKGAMSERAPRNFGFNVRPAEHAEREGRVAAAPKRRKTF